MCGYEHWVVLQKDTELSQRFEEAVWYGNAASAPIWIVLLRVVWLLVWGITEAVQPNIQLGARYHTFVALDTFLDKVVRKYSSQISYSEWRILENQK